MQDEEIYRHKQKKTWELNSWFQRPLSLFAALTAVLLIIYEIWQISSGQLYTRALGSIDGTTVIELGILALVGIFRLWNKTDLQATAFTLVNALSFIFSYEAIYKWSFYMAPFRLDMPSIEFRQMVIQIGISLSILTGFAVGFFTLRKSTFLWIGIFMALWIFWLAVGYPQITGNVIWPRIIPVEFTYGMTYLLNRTTKFVLWLAYLSLFRRSKEQKENNRLPAHSS
jgi:hypothetical protein